MVYVIIVTYNGLKWVDSCLSSIFGDKIVSGIIIIDNGSTDGTLEYIEKKFPECRLIKNSINRGFGQANNLGMKIALEEGAEYVFLLNQDAWIEGEAITRLVQIHQKHPEYGILSPIHLRGDGNAVDLKYGTFVMQSENSRLFSDLYLHRDKLDEIYSVYFVNAAAWLITKDCLKIVGGFSPVFFHYGEDMGYTNRVIYHHFKIGICPTAMVYHDRKNIIEYPSSSESERFLTYKKNLHLIYLTDINHSFFERYSKALVKTGMIVLNRIVRGNMRLAWVHFKEFRILLKTFLPLWKNSILVKKRTGVFLLSSKASKINSFQKKTNAHSKIQKINQK